MRGVWQPGLGAGLAALAAATALWHPAFRSFEATGLWDWQYFHHMWETGFVAFTRHGEWALWDPYHCGGITLFGNPQSQLFAPLYLLSFVVGPTLATKLWVLLHAAVGFAGMALFARREGGLGLPASLLVSVAWCASGFFAWHGARGHSTFMPFYYGPWLLLAWRAAARDPRFCAAVAGLMALVLLEGGVYPFCFFALWLGFDAAVRLGEPALRLRILLTAALSAGLTGLLGALRLLPIAEEMSRHKRMLQYRGESSDLATVLEMLTSREHELVFAGHRFLWSEYGAYVGWGVVALAAVGLLPAWRRRRRHWLFGALLFLGLMLGNHGAFSPWLLLQELPFYESLRVPSRFSVLFLFYVALLAGLGLQALGSAAGRLAPLAARPRLAAALPWAVLAVLALDLYSVNLRTVDEWRGRPITDREPAPRFHLSARHDYRTFMANFPQLGLGSPGCYEAMQVEVSQGLWTGPGPQARVRDGAGRVLEWGRTAHTAFAVVELTEPASVVFNQNHAPGWRSSLGEVRADAQGRLAVDEVPAGEWRIELRYRPRTLIPGLLASLLGLALTLGTGRGLTAARLDAAVARLRGRR